MTIIAVRIPPEYIALLAAFTTNDAVWIRREGFRPGWRGRRAGWLPLRLFLRL
jgi:hypothetical protein